MSTTRLDLISRQAMHNALHVESRLPQVASGGDVNKTTMSTNVPIFILPSGHSKAAELYNNEQVVSLNLNQYRRILPSNPNLGSAVVEPSLVNLSMPPNSVRGKRDAETRSTKNEGSQTNHVGVDTARPVASSNENELTINGITIKGVKAVYVVRDTPDDCHCSKASNTLSHQTLSPSSVISSPSHLASNIPVFIDDCARSAVVGSMCVPAHSNPTHTSFFQHYVNASHPPNGMVFANVVPQVQQQTCINLNSAAPMMVLSTLPQPPYRIATMDNSGTTNDIAGKMAPSTAAVSTGSQLPATFFMSTVAPPSSTIVTPTVPPIPSSFAMSSVAQSQTVVMSTAPSPYTTLVMSTAPAPYPTLVMSSAPPPYSTLTMSTPPPPPSTVNQVMSSMPSPSDLVKSVAPLDASTHVISTVPQTPPFGILSRMQPQTCTQIQPDLVKSAALSLTSTPEILTVSPPPSTDVMSAAPTQPSTDVLTRVPLPPRYQFIRVGNNSSNVVLSRNAPPFPKGSFAKPPSTYPMSSTMCHVKAAPSKFQYLSNEMQNPVNLMADVFDTTSLQAAIKDELDESQAEEMTVEVDPANYWDSSDADSPMKSFSTNQIDEPERITSQSRPNPLLHDSQTPRIECLRDYSRKHSITHRPIAVGSSQTRIGSGSVLTQLLQLGNDQAVSKVSESIASSVLGYTATKCAQSKHGDPSQKELVKLPFLTNMPQIQAGLDEESEGYNFQIEYDNHHRPISIVSKPRPKSANDVSESSLYSQIKHPQQTLLTSRQLESSLVHDLVCSMQSDDANVSEQVSDSGSNESRTGNLFLLKRYRPGMPGAEVVAASSNHLQTEHPNSSIRSNNSSSDESLIWHCPQRRLESKFTFGTQKHGYKDYSRVTVPYSVEWLKFTVSMDHNYNRHHALVPVSSQSMRRSVNNAKGNARKAPITMSERGLQRSYEVDTEKILQRTCRVVLKRLHPSHCNGSVVNLRFVSELDLFKPGMQTSRHKKRKCHWNKSRKVRVRKNIPNSRLPQALQSSKELKQEKVPLGEDMEVVETEPSQAKLNDTEPALEKITGTDSNAKYPCLKKLLKVKLDVLENVSSI